MDTVEEFSNAVSDFLNSENERAAIIFAFSMLEQFVGDLLKIKSKHPNSYKNLSVFLKMNLLNEIGAISDNEYEAIDWLRKQRNKAAHKPGFKVDQSSIKESWTMSTMTSKTLLQNYLVTTVIGFWNNHSEIRKFYGFLNNA